MYLALEKCPQSLLVHLNLSCNVDWQYIHIYIYSSKYVFSVNFFLLKSVESFSYIFVYYSSETTQVRVRHLKFVIDYTYTELFK